MKANKEEQPKKPKFSDFMMGLVFIGVIGYGFYYLFSMISF
jgi:hypothetical protein